MAVVMQPTPCVPAPHDPRAEAAADARAMVAKNGIAVGDMMRRGTVKCCAASSPMVADEMVTPARFERTTCPLGGDRSIQLSYGAMAKL